MNSDTTAYSVFFDKFLVDTEKNLFKVENNEKIFVQKLRKHLFKMVEFEGVYFFMDTFGDCFRLSDHSENSIPSLSFIFGILSTPSYFNVLNNRIYTVDKYSRVWVHDLDGEIINIAFINENIVDVYVGFNYCCAVTDGTEMKVEYSGISNNSNEKRAANRNEAKIFDRSFDLLRSVPVDRVISFQDDGISYETMGNIVELKIGDHNARKSLKLEY